MTVYVDDAFIPSKVGIVRAYWCHLTADTEGELARFVSGLSLPSAWQPKRDKTDTFYYYYITAPVVARAIQRGAVQKTVEEVVKHMTKRGQAASA